MIECTELAGKVIRDCTIYDESRNGTEVVIEFTDETIFSVLLTPSVAVEAKCVRDEGGEPQVLKNFTGSVSAGR